MARLWTPGSPKTCRTPSARSASTTHSPPVRSSAMLSFREGAAFDRAVAGGEYTTRPRVFDNRRLGRAMLTLLMTISPQVAVVGGGPAGLAAAIEAARAARMPRALPAPWSRWPLSGDASADWHTLRAARVPLTGSRAVARVVGDEKVREVLTVALDSDWRPVPGSEETLAVGAVCFVWDSVPSIQLSQLCGVEHEHVARGGWVPTVSADMETSARGIFCAGDGAGLGGAAMAALEGRIAGIAAASRLGVLSPGET